MVREELLLGELHPLPGWVAEHAVEAAVGSPEDAGILDLPVEEGVLGGEAADLVHDLRWYRAGAAREAADDAGGDPRRALLLTLDEGGAPGVGGELGALVGLRGEQVVEEALFGVQGLGGGVVGVLEPLDLGREAGDEVDRLVLERKLALALLLVLPAERLRGLLVVAGERLERVVGDPLGYQLGGRAEERVAAADVGVEEGERPAGLEQIGR